MKLAMPDTWTIDWILFFTLLSLCYSWFQKPSFLMAQFFQECLSQVHLPPPRRQDWNSIGEPGLPSPCKEVMVSSEQGLVFQDRVSERPETQWDKVVTWAITTFRFLFCARQLGRLISRKVFVYVYVCACICVICCWQLVWGRKAVSIPAGITSLFLK